MVSGRDGRFRSIDVILAEQNETARFGLAGMLREQGLRNLRTVATLKALIEEIKSQPADLIAVADTLGDDVYTCIRDLRHKKLGGNPFAVVTFMVAPDNEKGIKRAVMAGADDVMLKPIAPGKIVARAEHIANHRIPFIATTDYIGPNRRKGDRASKIPLINVVNTLKDKLDGKEVTSADLNAAIESGFKSIRTAQLDSQGLRLGYVCNLILKAYDNDAVDQDVENNLKVLVQCLSEAADAAIAVNEPDLAEICTKFGRRIEDFAANYLTPDDRALELIRTLTKAFQMAKEAAAERMPKDGFQTS